MARPNLDILRPIQTQKLYRHAASQIVRAIRDGALKPGQRLPSERELASVFGVSRASVREGLRALEILGMVESRRGSGSYVTATSELLSDEAIGDLEEGFDPLHFLEAREVIEGEIAAIAAKRRNLDDLSAIRAAIHDMRSATDDSSLEFSFHEADYRFHEHVAAATHNTSFVDVEKRLIWQRRRQAWQLAAERVVSAPGARSEIVEQHAAIQSAIEKGDGDAARRAMVAHMRAVRVSLHKFRLARK